MFSETNDREPISHQGDIIGAGFFFDELPDETVALFSGEDQ